MIVGVESNFVLVLAFQQEDADEARSILTLAEEKRIELVLPGCSLTEPYETLVRRTKDRQQLLEKLRREIGELARSEPFADLSKTSAEVTDALATSGTHQAAELQKVIRRICECATVIPTTETVAQEGFDAQQRFNLDPQDAFVFASIDIYMRHAPDGPKLFLNKNRRDFLNDDIKEHMATYGCELMPTFKNVRRRIEAQLSGKSKDD
jgi:hypothetical protein